MDWKIEYYQKENGKIPVYEFLCTLEPKMRAKVSHYIDLLEKAGTNLTEPYVSPIKGDRYKGLWELRVKFASDITRVFYFTFQGDTFVLSLAFLSYASMRACNCTILKTSRKRMRGRANG